MINIEYHPDPSQQLALERLQHIRARIERGHAVDRGVYLYGPVGRGKSMLMDAFYRQLASTEKCRLHYHHFMRDVHRELERCAGKADPLQHVALAWASRYRVICLDEFMVEDIADAMLLGTLFTHLFALDVVLITTSNTHPQSLYHNGLQRDRFLPAINLLMHHCEVVSVNGDVDYRRQQTQDITDFPFFTQRHSSDDWLQRLKEDLGPLQGPSEVSILGRTMQLLASNQHIAVFHFNDLCAGPRSQRGYMELAEQYRVIGVDQLPCFSYLPDKEIVHGVEETYQRERQDLHVSKLDNEARRFMALVDECYDRGCLVIVNTSDTSYAAAAARPEQLYQARQLHQPFARCASRLYEMQGWTLPDSQA